MQANPTTHVRQPRPPLVRALTFLQLLTVVVGMGLAVSAWHALVSTQSRSISRLDGILPQLATAMALNALSLALGGIGGLVRRASSAPHPPPGSWWLRLRTWPVQVLVGLGLAALPLCALGLALLVSPLSLAFVAGFFLDAISLAISCVVMLRVSR